jgi:phosphoglycerol transferase MdoB-like AlkP superfamily enzyme
MAVQEVLLFARPTPYGGPYAERWYRYLPYAISYNVLAVMLASAIPILVWLFWLRRPVRPQAARWVHYLQLGLLTLVVMLDQVDNELLRFMGTHLTFGLLQAYYKVNAWGTDMVHIFATDRGGPWLPFVLLFAAPLVLWWGGRKLIRNGSPLPLLWPLPAALVASLIPLVLPYVAYDYLQGKKFIWRQTRPAVLTLYSEVRSNISRAQRPEDFDRLIREYQARWLENSGDSAWKFPDPELPLLRVPLTPGVTVPGPHWNVIYLQLETFRAWNTGFLRPDIPSSTPFLDSLARDQNSAFWTRHLSMGPPTVSGVMAALCSIKPHSSSNITSTFTYTSFHCLPQVLRQHGYVAESFTGSDPDWDGEKTWLRQWYDQYHYYEDAEDNDRPVFRRAAERIRELGRGSRPFLAVVTSISNHYPFRSREPQFQLDQRKGPEYAINNTMRYTDDVVREFVDSLRREPWFSRTLLVIVGDHGYELGEHGRRGQHTGWRESVWVPLIIHGAHPRLRPGSHNDLATLLDLSPTVADLLGIREANPWMGVSLLRPAPKQRSFALSHWGAVWGDRGDFSVVVDPSSGKALVYDAIHDPLQRTDISAQHPEVAAATEKQAKDELRLVNYLLEANRIWRPSGEATQPGTVAGRGK